MGLVAYNTTNNELESFNGTAWEAVGTNAADAAGSTGQVQFNNSGDLGADSNFFWDNTNKRLGIGTASPTSLLTVYGGDALINGVTVGVGGGSVNKNAAFGYLALANNTTGYDNIGIGYNASQFNTTGRGNIAIGDQALRLNNGYSYNTAVGENTLVNSQSNFNTALGAYALTNATSGNYLTAIGNSALQAVTTGTNDTALGAYAGYDVTTGNNNIIIGYYPTGGVGVTTGSNNIMLGYDVRPPSQTASNQLNIGNLIYGTGIGTGSVASTGNVGIGTTSPRSTLEVAGNLEISVSGAPSSALPR